jgi:hypothetical protein
MDENNGKTSINGIIKFYGPEINCRIFRNVRYNIISLKYIEFYYSVFSFLELHPENPIECPNRNPFRFSNSFAIKETLELKGSISFK